MQKSLIVGITGQDGSILAELLLSKGYEVHGIMRRSSSFNTGRIEHIFQDEHAENRKMFLHHGDVLDSSNLISLLNEVKPDEVYNLAAQSHVRVSFDIPEYTTDVIAMGSIRLLEAIRSSGIHCKYYNAASSEMFGASPPPQNESTPFCPCSPYAIAKVASYWHTVNYRKSYKMFASNGILMNHESIRRGETFVSRKITKAIANILARKQQKLYLGNLDAKRDWGYAPDFVEAMWLIMQHDIPDDFVIATGESHTVKEFLDEAFRLVNLDWHDYVEIDSRYFRPQEVEHLEGDYSKARKILGWEPKVGFRQLVRIMVKADLDMAGLHYVAEKL